MHCVLIEHYIHPNLYKHVMIAEGYQPVPSEVICHRRLGAYWGTKERIDCCSSIDMNVLIAAIRAEINSFARTFRIFKHCDKEGLWCDDLWRDTILLVSKLGTSHSPQMSAYHWTDDSSHCRDITPFITVACGSTPCNNVSIDIDNCEEYSGYNWEGEQTH